MELTHYQVLEIDQTANPNQIRKRYLEMAIKYHPDKNRHLPEDQYLKTEAKFQQVTKAFHVLSDPNERSKYDQKLKFLNTQKKKKADEPQPFYAYQNGSYSFMVSSTILGFANKLFSNGDPKFKNIGDFAKIFKQFTTASGLNENENNLPEIVRNYKKFYQRKEKERKAAEERYRTQVVRKPRTRVRNINQNSNLSKKENSRKVEKKQEPRNHKILDLVYTANVSLRDIYLNIPKELNVPRKRICHHCLGVGYLGYGTDMSLCQICKGVMIVTDSKVFPINIKENKLIFKGEGHQSLEKEVGDLIIYIQPKPHSEFRIINQYDLLYTHAITLTELYQDLEIEIKHLDGTKELVEYLHTDLNSLRNRQLLRVKEKGLLIGDSNRRGDLYIKLEVELPILELNQLKELEKILDSRKSTIKDHEDLIKIKAELPADSYQVDG